MSHRENIARIRAVSNALGDLKNEVVFVGGATVSLYATRPVIAARPTDDVDIAVEITSYKHFSSFEEQLRKIGFQNDKEGHVGRFIIDGLIVDIIPTAQTELGFYNVWYKDGFETAVNYRIDDQNEVKIFTSPYFIASKFEAIKGRRPIDDLRYSKDLEDIVFILENRSGVWAEMASAADDVQDYLMKEFKALHKNPYIEELIDGHASIKSPSSVYFILEDIENFIH